jgi:hypothetical protein
MPAGTFAKRALAVAVAVLACACGSGDSPASPSGRASLTLGMAPSPVLEAVCPPSACGSGATQLYAVGTLTLRETAGVGGRVESLAMTQRTGAGVTQGSGQFDASAVAGLAGSSRFAANGSLEVPGIGVHYDPALGGTPATLTVTLQATDDGGHSVSATLAVPVTPLAR